MTAVMPPWRHGVVQIRHAARSNATSTCECNINTKLQARKPNSTEFLNKVIIQEQSLQQKFNIENILIFNVLEQRKTFHAQPILTVIALTPQTLTEPLTPRTDKRKSTCATKKAPMFFELAIGAIYGKIAYQMWHPCKPTTRKQPLSPSTSSHGE